MKRSVLGWAAIVTGVMLAAIATIGAHRTRPTTPTDAGIDPLASARATATSPTPGAPTPAPRATTPHSTGRAPTHSAAGLNATPERLVIPALHIDAAVHAVSVDETGALQVPDDPRAVGWWSDGAPVGSTAGHAVIDGHVDSATSGPGALFRLSSVQPGTEVSVTTSSGVVDYTVVGRRVFGKQSLPAAVFSRTGPPLLVLITCGGPFDKHTGHYADNIVVFAQPMKEFT
jgi:hypothetical protein